jgi:predicted NBD/HSP70 family sugar kinase
MPDLVTNGGGKQTQPVYLPSVTDPNGSDGRHPGRRRGRSERDALALVLRLVRSRDGATRQELEILSGLSRAVVADRLTLLLELGLVEEGDLRASTGGRSPRLVHFRSKAGYLLAGAIGSTTLGVGFSDLSGRLLAEHHEARDAALGPDRVVDRIATLFEWLLEEHPAARELWGIGLALPGAVRLPNGRLSAHGAQQLVPGWQDFPVTERLSQRLGSPVYVDNEVHLMALGELHAGRGSVGDDLLFVKVGTGIGAALCSGGAVHRGAHGFAGDIGHLVVSDESGTICRCGNTGCLEALAGGAAIAREASAAARDGRSAMLADVLADREITAADVGTAAHRGDPYSIELLANAGQQVGGVVAALVNGYNPSLVVVGGGLAQAGEVLLAAIRDAIFRRSRSLATQSVQVVRAEMGKTATLVGASLSVADELFSWEYLRQWIDHGSPVAAVRDVDHAYDHARPTGIDGRTPGSIERLGSFGPVGGSR